MTWNIEGLRRNIHNLVYFCNTYQPDLIFLSEPQIFECDVDIVMSFLKDSYSFSLNTADVHDPDIPLLKKEAKGGTMILWKREHAPYIVTQSVSSSAFLPVLFNPPGYSPSLHLCVYLPTQGHEQPFVEELAHLMETVETLQLAHPDTPVYLRGDFNVSHKNIQRVSQLNAFISHLKLQDLPIPHTTYHHFLGNGMSDSHLDRLICSADHPENEVLDSIICKHDDYHVDSHHDLLLSSWTAREAVDKQESNHIILAPRLTNLRHRILWSDEGILKYQSMVLPHLLRLQKLWLTPSPTRSCLSLFLQSTNEVLTSCAKICNKSIDLSKEIVQKARSIPKNIRISSRNLLNKWKVLRQLKRLNPANSPDVIHYSSFYRQERSNHRKLVRSHLATVDSSKLTKLMTDPSAVYKSIRQSKKTDSGKINKLKVGEKVYCGEKVPDGFYDSIGELKRKNPKIDESRYFQSFTQDYTNIIELCKNEASLEPISETDTLLILQRMKPDVLDVFSLTPNHYLYAGPPGWKHFSLMLNTLLADLKNIDICEINRVHACVLFKGKGKDKTSSRSYRTISTCPVVAKALDIVIRDRKIDLLNADQSSVQFQGEGSSHELAAILLTECIQFSLNILKQPMYALYLDAQSAFDVVQRELLVKNLFNVTGPDQALLYIDKRISGRQTVVEWDRQLMGPILDEQGLEQGGVSSSDFYKIFGKEQLSLAQRSQLGVPLPVSIISAVGQADDTVLLSNDIYSLFYLLKLSSTVFCEKSLVDLCAEKTVLQVFKNRNWSPQNNLMDVNPIKINDKPIPFSINAEHVGVLRSSEGNLPSITARFAAHRRALSSILHTGLAYRHRGNPSYNVRIEKLYATPVLLSGLGTLVLKKSELDMIDRHFSNTLCRLLKLHDKTPRCVTHFLAGTLPASALLHMRQVSLYSMICRLKNNELYLHAYHLFSNGSPHRSSWFHQIDVICKMYSLPNPIYMLDHPPQKNTFKIYVKKKIISYWELKLRDEAQKLKSLRFFKPQYMSLTKPHPLFVTAGSSPDKSRMACIQAKMLSGRYRCESLVQYWVSSSNGLCQLSPFL